MKPGIKTTEFWAVAVANVALFITTVSGGLPASVLKYALPITVGLYAVSRAIAKLNWTNKAPEEF